MKFITPYKFYMTQSDKDQLMAYMDHLHQQKDLIDKNSIDYFDGLISQTQKVLDNVVVIPDDLVK